MLGHICQLATFKCCGLRLSRLVSSFHQDSLDNTSLGRYIRRAIENPTDLRWRAVKRAKTSFAQMIASGCWQSTFVKENSQWLF
jgi:hypothetical protein